MQVFMENRADLELIHLTIIAVRTKFASMTRQHWTGVCSVYRKTTFFSVGIFLSTWHVFVFVFFSRATTYKAEKKNKKKQQTSMCPII